MTTWIAVPAGTCATGNVPVESLVAETKEKEVISDKAIGGLYYFKKGSTFVSNAKFMVENDMRTKGEFYIAPVYNLLIDRGKKIGIDKNTRHDILGTPEDLEKLKWK